MCSFVIPVLFAAAEESPMTKQRLAGQFGRSDVSQPVFVYHARKATKIVPNLGKHLVFRMLLTRHVAACSS